MRTIIFLDSVLFGVVAVLASTLRGKFESRPCVRVEQSCACAGRKRDARGRFTK